MWLCRKLGVYNGKGKQIHWSNEKDYSWQDSGVSSSENKL